MKLKKGFVLKEVAGQCVVIPVDAALNFNGMINLNSTGKMLWSLLEKGATLEELTAAMVAAYDIDEATASADASEFVETLKGRGFIE